MPPPELDDSRVVSVRLPYTMVQRLDRLLDWYTTHRRRPTTRNAAIRDALCSWLDHQEQLAGLLEPHVLGQEFQAAYDSLRSPLHGVPIYRLRRLLQWPREQFDAVLQALRAARAVGVEALSGPAVGADHTQDSYHVGRQRHGDLRWRAYAEPLSPWRSPRGSYPATIDPLILHRLNERHPVPRHRRLGVPDGSAARGVARASCPGIRRAGALEGG